VLFRWNIAFFRIFVNVWAPGRLLAVVTVGVNVIVFVVLIIIKELSQDDRAEEHVEFVGLNEGLVQQSVAAMKIFG
jgi:hypothetical protein